MKQAILDTNFILSCVKQKINFLDEIKFMGMDVLIPEEVLDEVKNIMNSKKKLHFREDAKLALKILGKNKFKKIKLGTSHVDKGLVNFSKKNKDVVVATLDKELKRKIKKPKLVIRGKNKLEVI